jgi:hypothetical protein
VLDEETYPLKAIGIMAILFMFIMMLYNHYRLNKIKTDGVETDGAKINEEQRDKHKIAYHTLHFLALTDMELICLLPWRDIEDANGFPLDTVKTARIAAGIEDGVQLLMQIVYLICKSKMDWATLPSMCLTIGSQAFRCFVSAEQVDVSKSTSSATSTIRQTVFEKVENSENLQDAAFEVAGGEKERRGIELPTRRDSSSIRKGKLVEALRTEGLHQHADMLWDMGLYEPHQLVR